MPQIVLLLHKNFEKRIILTSVKFNFDVIDEYNLVGEGGAIQIYDLGRDVPLTKTWNVVPFLYQILPKQLDPFWYQCHKFKQNLLNILLYFSKLLSFQANFWNCWNQLHEIGPIFEPVLENFEKVTNVCTCFCTE